MGIVVTFYMFFGVLLLSPLAKGVIGEKISLTNAKWMTCGLFLAGAWNAFWHGFRHIDLSWGIAALISGFFMMMAAILIFRKRTDYNFISHSLYEIIFNVLNKFSLVIWLGLLLSFLVYAVSLILLNLGLPMLL